MKTKQYIEQVRDGVHYKGTIDFEGTVLEFEVRFGVPIAELEADAKRRKERGEEVTDEVIRGLFQITVKKNGLLVKSDAFHSGFSGFFRNIDKTIFTFLLCFCPE